jgi:dTDP-glucose 4,6-dehydratase
MKVLVIGASSFTGRHFCDYARLNGAQIEEVSLRNLKEVVAALAHAQPYIVNFAALNVVAPSWQYPSDYLFTNVYALTSVLDFLKDKSLTRFVQVSTPEVYGSSNGWMKEDHPFFPSTPYAISRAAAEMMMSAYHKQYGFPVVFTRGANVYGPGQQLYRLIPKVIASIKHSIPFPLEGGGASKRGFVHVRDTVNAIWRVLNNGKNGTAYHIATREMQTINAIVTHICERMKTPIGAAVELVAERPGKDAAYMLDSGRIRAELGWQDTVTMDSGIDEVIAWIERDWETLKHIPLVYEHRP